MTAGLATHDDIIEIEEGEGGALSQSRLSRPPRIRGSACLTRELASTSGTSAPATGNDPSTVRFLGCFCLRFCTQNGPFKNGLYGCKILFLQLNVDFA